MRIAMLIILVPAVVSCKQHYSCGVPNGESCRSLSQVYHDTINTDAEAELSASFPAAHGEYRIWIAPWTDASGNRHSAMFLYPGSPGD